MEKKQKGCERLATFIDLECPSVNDQDMFVVIHGMLKKVNSIVKVIRLNVGDGLHPKTFVYLELNCKPGESKEYDVMVAKHKKHFPKNFESRKKKFIVRVELYETRNFGKDWNKCDLSKNLLGSNPCLYLADDVGKKDYHCFVLVHNYGGNFLKDKRTAHNAFYFIKYEFFYQMYNYQTRSYEEDILIGRDVGFYFKKQSNTKPKGYEETKQRFYIMTKPFYALENEVVIAETLCKHPEEMDLIESSTHQTNSVRRRRIPGLNEKQRGRKTRKVSSRRRRQPKKYRKPYRYANSRVDSNPLFPVRHNQNFNSEFPNFPFTPAPASNVGTTFRYPPYSFPPPPRPPRPASNIQDNCGRNVFELIPPPELPDLEAIEALPPKNENLRGNGNYKANYCFQRFHSDPLEQEQREILYKNAANWSDKIDEEKIERDDNFIERYVDSCLRTVSEEPFELFKKFNICETESETTSVHSYHNESDEEQNQETVNFVFKNSEYPFENSMASSQVPEPGDLECMYYPETDHHIRLVNYEYFVKKREEEEMDLGKGENESILGKRKLEFLEVEEESAKKRHKIE